MIINEEYKSWKKNSLYVYDLIISHALEWPSLTFQWSPTQPVPFDDYALHSCLISENATEKEQSYLLLASVKVPLEKEIERQARSNKKIDKDEQTDSILKSNTPKFEITAKIPHQGEINRARYCPFASHLIASKTISGEVLIFNTNNPGTEPVIKPSARLVGHSSEGYGLAWNPREKSLILSGSNDKRILLWDIESSVT
jgi:histone-binding protein RBBP4